jgi:uroporphyrinogen decarboxylase
MITGIPPGQSRRQPPGRACAAGAYNNPGMRIGARETNFDGLPVAAFESRHAAEMAGLISRFGGRPIVAPSVRELPLGENGPALEFGEALMAGGVDIVVFMTGVGTRYLAQILATRWAADDVAAALSRTTVVARGPKPVKALRELGVPVSLSVPEPNTWREVVEALESEPRGLDLAGARVAVQEYGVANPMFLQALEARGAVVRRIPVYRWALPEDTAPLRDAIERIAAGEIRIVLFTNATQVEHLLQVAEEMGAAGRLRDGLARGIICSIGPTCSEALQAHELPVDLEPEHPRMGMLVKEASERTGGLLANLQAGRPGASPIRPRSHTPAQPLPCHDSRFMRACRREPVDATPIWLMRQAGRYMPEYRELRGRVSFLELCKNPALVSQVTVGAAQRIGADAAILFADILLVVEPMGLQLEYNRGDGPAIHPVVRESADVDRLCKLDSTHSLEYVFEAVRRTRADLDPAIPLLGFAGAPFTLASYVIEGGASRSYENTKRLMYRDPGAWHALLQHIARLLAVYLNGQVDAGAQAVQLFDSWVGCLAPCDYREFVLPHTRSVIQSVSPGVPVIHFGTGTASLLEAMREAGGAIIGLDWRVELDEAWGRLGSDVGIMGNLDPVVLLGDQAYVRGRAKRILAQAAGRPGHIFNLGHGILPQTPVENVIALVEAVHELSAR